MALLHPIMRSFGSLLNRLLFLRKKLWTMSSESAAFVHSLSWLWNAIPLLLIPLCIRQNLNNLFKFQAKLRICLNLLFTILLKITFSTETHTKIFLELNTWLQSYTFSLIHISVLIRNGPKDGYLNIFLHGHLTTKLGIL